MKNIITIIFVCLLINSVTALPVFIQGHVLDSFGSGVQNKNVQVYVQQSFLWVPFGSNTTNAIGQFNVNGNVVDSTALFQFLTFDCQGDSVVWTAIYDATVSDSVITSVTICSNNPPSCTATFNYSISNSIPNTVDFTSILFPQPSGSAIITWDFDDGNTSNALNPTHTYADTGSYFVCVLYNDSSINCLYSACLLIYVPPFSNNCNASFTFQDYSPAFAFFGNSNLGPSSAYSWDFGDGNASQGLNAVHLYQNPGMYEVCFYASSVASNCSFCDSVLVDFDSSLLRIGGNVGGGIPPTESNTMILYQDNNPFISAIDTTISVNGIYRFEGLNQGNYLVKCLPGNQSANPGFIPKYWPSSPYWGDATSVFLTSGLNGVSFTFNSSGVSLNGSGSITVDVKNATGQALENTTVWLEDVNKNILAYEVTDNTGVVTFDNLPFDNYSVWADYPGYLMFPYNLSPNTQNPDLNLNLKILGNWITTSIEDENLERSIKIYPNPVSDQFFISTEIHIDELNIRDLSGRQLVFNVEKTSEFEYQVKLRNAVKGLYILNMKTEKGSISKKLMVTEN